MAINNNLSTATPVVQDKPVFTLADLTPGSNPFFLPPPLTLDTLRMPLDTPWYYVLIVIQTYSHIAWNTIGTLEASSAIVLTMPQNIIDTMSVRFQETPLGYLGAGALNSLSGFSNQQLGQKILSAFTAGGLVVGGGALQTADNILGNLPSKAVAAIEAPVL